MTTQKNSINSQNHHAQSLNQRNEVDIATNNFATLYNQRATFFSEKFIKRVKEMHKKALSELLRHPLPPTQMDLRQPLTQCLKANVADGYVFSMKDGKLYTMQDLKRLVPEWSAIAEKALMESDPALADKLMSRAQWNAKSAFEVTFVSAMDDLEYIKNTGQVTRNFEHYMKWTISPLQKAIESVREVDPPGNSLINYYKGASLSEAMALAENLEDEFRKELSKKMS